MNCENNIKKCICKKYNVKCLLKVWNENGDISDFVYEHLTMNWVA